MSLPPVQSLAWLHMLVLAPVVWEPPLLLLLYTWKGRLEEAQLGQRVERVQVRKRLLPAGT